jgi:hypothetical protein
MNNIRKQFRSKEASNARAAKTQFEVLDKIYDFMLTHMVELGPNGIEEPFDTANGYFDVQIFGGYAMYRNLQLLASPDGFPFILRRLSAPIIKQIEAVEAKIAKLKDIKSKASNGNNAATKSKIRRVNRQLGSANQKLDELHAMLPTKEKVLAVQQKYTELLHLFLQSRTITTSDIDFKVFTKDNILKSEDSKTKRILDDIKPIMSDYLRTIMTDTLQAISGEISFNNNRSGKYYKFLKAGAVDIAFMVDHKIPALEVYERYFTSLDPTTPFNGTYPGLTDTTIPVSTSEDARDRDEIVPCVAAIPLMWANQTHLAVLAISGVLSGKYTNKNKSISKVIGRLLMANAMYYPDYDFNVVYDYLNYIDWLNTNRGFDVVMATSVTRKATANNKQAAMSLARELLMRYVELLIVSPEQARLVELIINEDAEFKRDLVLSDVDIARVKGVLMLSRFSAADQNKAVMTGGKVDVAKMAGSNSKQQFIRQASGKSAKNKGSKGSSQRTKKAANAIANNKSAIGNVVPYNGKLAALDDDKQTPADKFIMRELLGYEDKGYTTARYQDMESVNGRIDELHKMMSKLK